MLVKTTTLALTLAALTAPMAFAKGHDQGMSKGETVMTVTVPAAQGLGEALREARGFNNTRQ
jgi:hypothetical protein